MSWQIWKRIACVVAKGRAMTMFQSSTLSRTDGEEGDVRGFLEGVLAEGVEAPLSSVSVEKGRFDALRAIVEGGI